MYTIEFGKYAQNGSKEKTPIEWLVLKEDADTLFVFSSQSITCMAFDVEDMPWEKSAIRKWLNTEFFDQAFRQDEKSCIKRTSIQTWDCYGYFRSWTEDEIFLLGIDEIETYFPVESSRADTKTGNAWWLRDEGAYDLAVVLIAKDGSYDAFAGPQNVRGIRPAMRILKNYKDLVVPEIPILEGQIRLFDNREEDTEDANMALESELNQILTELDMDPLGNRSDFRWLEEVILLAVRYPNTWQARYLELIGKREGITRERVRQILYKAVWDHWTPQSAHVLSNHFGHPIQTQFQRVKPTHIEFIALLSEQLLRKQQIQAEYRSDNINEH